MIFPFKNAEFPPQIKRRTPSFSFVSDILFSCRQVFKKY